ncbi:MAG: hypothetical protein ABIR29_08975 [Chthoniobacterales bacterium]
MGLRKYEDAIVAGLGSSEPVVNKEPRLKGDAGGLHFELTLAQSRIKAGQPAPAKLRISKADGSGFDRLEPVMVAFAHLAGFGEEKETAPHASDRGSDQRRKGRGGPGLEFKIYATKPVFVRLFAKVQVNGRQLFVPFNVEVTP